jgi:hypothetical protein
VKARAKADVVENKVAAGKSSVHKKQKLEKPNQQNVIRNQAIQETTKTTTHAAPTLQVYPSSAQPAALNPWNLFSIINNLMTTLQQNWRMASLANMAHTGVNAGAQSQPQSQPDVNTQLQKKTQAPLQAQAHGARTDSGAGAGTGTAAT